MAEQNYKRIGQFIYGAHRHGANRADIENWMADDLGVARSNSSADHVTGEPYAAFFAKYVCDDEFEANYARFIETLKNRAA